MTSPDTSTTNITVLVVYTKVLVVKLLLNLFWVGPIFSEGEDGNFDFLPLIWFLCVPQLYTLGTTQKQQKTPQTTEKRNSNTVPQVRGVAMVTPLTTPLLKSSPW